MCSVCCWCAWQCSLPSCPSQIPHSKQPQREYSAFGEWVLFPVTKSDWILVCPYSPVEIFLRLWDTEGKEMLPHDMFLYWSQMSHTLKHIQTGMCICTCVCTVLKHTHTHLHTLTVFSLPTSFVRHKLFRQHLREWSIASFFIFCFF